MDKNILSYANKETNVMLLYNEFGEPILSISREFTKNSECLYISVVDGEETTPLYPPLWHNPKADKKNNETPKHTGGKKPYLMLMIDEIEELRSQGVKNVEELIGYVACLGKYIEWNTGKLIHKRSKKPIQYKDLLNIYSCSNKKLNKMINLMKEHDLLYYTDEGYFISSKYIKKGKSK
ncbi:hypothetical protein FYJ83_10820 [Tissierella sp. DSM 105185]|uniref:Uncharacterized protein n=1 Tax=Tissierella pigra TaxID=2607614 RepID=A0A6N7Y1R9_9FIRM|nr:hypothetical protein [Tissierella pigra]